MATPHDHLIRHAVRYLGEKRKKSNHEKRKKENTMNTYSFVIHDFNYFIILDIENILPANLHIFFYKSHTKLKDSYLCIFKIMKYNFDEIIPRKGSGSLKHDGYEAFFGASDLLPMWVADMDFATPDVIRHAISERLQHPVLGYFYHSDSFYNAIVQWMKKRHNWTIEKEWIIYTPTILVGLAAIVNAFSKKGDNVLIQPPVYHPFFNIIRAQSRNVVENPLIAKDGAYHIDFEDLENKLKKGVKIMFLCNPHNPVGRCWTAEELEKIGNLCLTYHTLLISDEIHSDLMMRGYTHTVLASLSPEIAENTITCMSPTKTFNLAGMNTAEIIISNRTLRKELIYLMHNQLYINSGNVFGDVALEAAYTRGEEWLEQLLDYLTENVKFSQQFIAQNLPKITGYRHEATYLLWLNFSRYNLPHEKLKDILVHQAKLALNDGEIFGVEGKQHFRMNLACPRIVIQEAMQRLTHFLSDY